MCSATHRDAMIIKPNRIRFVIMQMSIYMPVYILVALCMREGHVSTVNLFLMSASCGIGFITGSLFAKLPQVELGKVISISGKNVNLIPVTSRWLSWPHEALKCMDADNSQKRRKVISSAMYSPADWALIRDASSTAMPPPTPRRPSAKGST